MNLLTVDEVAALLKGSTIGCTNTPAHATVLEPSDFPT
jgi:hypothetical protein